MYEVKNSENKDMFLKYCCTVSFHFSPGYTQQEKNKQQRGVARGGAGWREVSGRAAYASFTRWLKLASAELGQTPDGWPRKPDFANHLVILWKGR